MLGVRSAARDAYLVLEATAQEQYQRWFASMNLMEIAAREGSMPMFERYRRALAGTALPPALEAQFHLQAAESFEALAQLDDASDAAERARAIAERYGFNEIAFKAGDLQIRVQSGVVVTERTPEAETPEKLKPIAATISGMRRLVPV